MKQEIFRDRLSLPVWELKEIRGNWEVDLELHSKVKQAIFISGFIREYKHKAVSSPLEIQSSTHKTLLKPAIFADARAELVGDEECKLRVCFNKTLSPRDTIFIRLTSRRWATSVDDLSDLTGDIEIEIPAKEIMSPKVSLREWLFPANRPISARYA